MNKLIVVNAMVAACITGLGIGIYDITVRQPRTPRLALIDIARVYSAAERALKERSLARGPQDGPAPASTSAAGLQRADDFGRQLQSVLQGLSDECRCAIVAMATVVGADASIPDFTDEAARRLGVQIRQESPR